MFSILCRKLSTASSTILISCFSTWRTLCYCLHHQYNSLSVMSHVQIKMFISIGFSDIFHYYCRTSLADKIWATFFKPFNFMIKP